MYDSTDQGKNLKSFKFLILDESSTNKEHSFYRLIGIIQHIGGGVNSGHYNCAWRGFDDQSWHLFDDSSVNYINRI